MGLSRTSSKVITVVPNLAADSVAATVPYADKDVVGDLLTLSLAVQNTKGSALLQSIVVRNLGTTKFAMDFFFFNEAPASSFGANNSQYAVAAADMGKFIGVVSIDAVAVATWNEASASRIVATKSNIGLPLQALARSKDFYVVPVIRTAVTFVTASDLSIDFGFLQD